MNKQTILIQNEIIEYIDIRIIPMVHREGDVLEMTVRINEMDYTAKVPVSRDDRISNLERYIKIGTTKLLQSVREYLDDTHTS